MAENNSIEFELEQLKKYILTLQENIIALQVEITKQNTRLNKVLEVAEPIMRKCITYDGETVYELKKKYSWGQLEKMSGVRANTLRKRKETYEKKLIMQNVDQNSYEE